MTKREQNITALALVTVSILVIIIVGQHHQLTIERKQSREMRNVLTPNQLENLSDLWEAEQEAKREYWDRYAE